MEEIPKYMTLPYELEFRSSAAEPNKIGVWSKCAIKKDELYGPFLGERRKISEVFDGTYSWEIRGPKGRRLFSIDATDPLNSNWMRYVKSARFYEEQNMIAVQEDRNIFYKALRKIPDGEELLCWYKGETSSTSLPLKSKLKKSYTTHNGNTTADRGTKRKYENRIKPRNGDKGIFLPDQDVSLLDLNEGLPKKIATGLSVNETSSRAPIVKLIPLSAEIKLKVHLDLEIHLDSDVKAREVLPPDEDLKSKRTSYSVNQELMVSEKSNKSIYQTTETDSSLPAETRAEKHSKQKDNVSTSFAICPMNHCKEEFLKNDASQSNNMPNTVCTFEAKLPSDECHSGNKIVFETHKVLTLENVAIVENQTAENVDVKTFTNSGDYSNGHKIPLVENVIICPNKTPVNDPVSINQSSNNVDQSLTLKNESDSSSDTAGNKNLLTTTKNIHKMSYKCHLCSKAFRKHFHLKIHSSKVHAKPEKNIKGFVARKRDKIRTRSVSYSEKGIENSNIENQNDGDFEMSLENKYDDSIQEDNICNDTKTPYNTCINISDNHNILRKPSNKVAPALVKKVSSIVHFVKKKMPRCRYCKQVFKYKSWLTRHMIVHQLPSIAGTNKQNDVEKPLQREYCQSAFIPDVIKEKRECDVKITTSKFATGKEPDDIKPFSCSYCGKHFTTSKNCRRHKRLVHSILVRPERTKLTYSNYIIEKKIPPNYDEHMKANFTFTKTKVHSDISKTLPRKTNKALDIHEVRRVANRKRDSSHISVRLFDPSQTKQSDINRCNLTPTLKTKLGWRTYSRRTGPSSVANKCMRNTSDKEDQDFQYQKTLFSYVPATKNYWTKSRQPDPFIPKKSTHSNAIALFNEAEYHSSISLPTCHQITYSPSDKNTTNLDTNQPIDLSSKNKVQKNEGNFTSSLSGLVSISSNGADAQSSNVMCTKEILDRHVFQKETFNLKQLNLGRKCDTIRNYSTSQVGNDDQKYQHSKQNYTIPKPIKCIQSQFEKYKPTFKEVTATGGTLAQYLSPTMEAARLQNQMVTVFKPILAEVEKDDFQIQPECNITQSRVTYSCNVCSLQFLTLRLLSHHISDHADDWPYKCEFCIKLFRTPQELVIHRKSQHLPCKIASYKTYKCKFANKTVLEEHQEAGHNSPTKLKSNKSSNANVAESTSQQIAYPDTQLQISPTYRCTKCSMLFSKTFEFHSHIIDCALNGKDT